MVDILEKGEAFGAPLRALSPGTLSAMAGGIMDSLTQEIVAANTGVACLDRLVRQLQLLVYQKLQSVWSLSLDNAHSVIVGFSPQLPGLIQNFQYTGRPFSAYLLTHLKYYVRKMLQRQWKNYRSQEVLECELSENEADESNCELILCEKFDTGVNPTPPTTHLKPTRLLFLMLRSAWSVDDVILNRVSAQTGIGISVLHAMVAEARSTLLGRYSLRQRLYEQRASLLHQIYLIQVQAKMSNETLVHGNFLKSEGKLRDMIVKVDLRLDRLKLTPSHSVIAGILGLTRSTVGSLSSRLKHSNLVEALSCGGGLS